LVLCLHGVGERGSNPEKLTKWGSFLCSQTPASSAIVILPQCRSNRYWKPDDIADFTAYVCRHYHIDRHRVYLIGYSMGAFGAWTTASAHPEIIAAIVPIADAGNIPITTQFAKVPIWAFHGEQDQVVPVIRTMKLVDDIRKAGGSPRLTVLPGAGHGILKQVCQNPSIWPWLFRQNLSQRGR
jgi:predicted peptidase